MESVTLQELVHYVLPCSAVQYSIVQYSIVQYTVHWVSELSADLPHSHLSTLDTVQCTLYSVHFTLYSVQWALYTVQCALSILSITPHQGALQSTLVISAVQVKQ